MSPLSRDAIFAVLSGMTVLSCDKGAQVAPEPVASAAPSVAAVPAAAAAPAAPAASPVAVPSAPAAPAAVAVPAAKEVPSAAGKAAEKEKTCSPGGCAPGQCGANK